MAVYKSLPLEQAVNRQVQNLSSEERTVALSVVADFISHFKEKHLS